MQIGGLSSRQGAAALRRWTVVYAEEAPLQLQGSAVHFALKQPLGAYSNATLRLSFGGSCTRPALSTLTVNGRRVAVDAALQIAGRVRRDLHTDEFFFSQAIPLPAALLAAEGAGAQLLEAVFGLDCDAGVYTLASGVLELAESLGGR